MPAFTKKQQVAKYQKMLNDLMRKYHAEMGTMKRHEEYLKEAQRRGDDKEHIERWEKDIQQDKREILVVRKNIFNVKKKLASLGVHANVNIPAR